MSSASFCFTELSNKEGMTDMVNVANMHYPLLMWACKAHKT